MRVEILRSAEPTVWNDWISQAEWGTICQTTFWSDRLSELWDCQPYFFIVSTGDGDLPALVLLGFDIHSDLIISEDTSFSTRIMEIPRKLLRTRRRFQWFGQPALISPEAREEAYRFLLSEISRFARVNQIRAVGPSEVPVWAGGLLPADWDRREWATLLVDLRQSEDALWKNLKKTARKAIRYARERGVVVRQISSLEDLRAYYDFACKCAARYDKQMYGFVDYETMWRHFRRHAIFETFVAEKDGEPLAGLSVWGYNGIVSEVGSFQSDRSFREKLYGSDLIKWEVLHWCSKQGYRTFDLAGVNPEPRTQKERGIRQFKEKWGGQYQPYCIVSLRV